MDIGDFLKVVDWNSLSVPVAIAVRYKLFLVLRTIHVRQVEAVLCVGLVPKVMLKASLVMVVC